MLTFFKPVLTFLCMGVSAVVPLSMCMGDPLRREEHTWASSDCLFDLSRQTTVLECSKTHVKDSKSLKKTHKFLLLRNYATGKLNRLKESKKYKFKLVGDEGILMFLTESSKLLDHLYIKEMKNGSADSSSNVETFMQKPKQKIPEELEETINRMTEKEESSEQ